MSKQFADQFFSILVHFRSQLNIHHNKYSCKLNIAATRREDRIIYTNIPAWIYFKTVLFPILSFKSGYFLARRRMKDIFSFFISNRNLSYWPGEINEFGKWHTWGRIVSRAELFSVPICSRCGIVSRVDISKVPSCLGTSICRHVQAE